MLWIHRLVFNCLFISMWNLRWSCCSCFQLSREFVRSTVHLSASFTHCWLTLEILQQVVVGWHSQQRTKLRVWFLYVAPAAYNRLLFWSRQSQMPHKTVICDCTYHLLLYGTPGFYVEQHYTNFIFSLTLSTDNSFNNSSIVSVSESVLEKCQLHIWLMPW